MHDSEVSNLLFMTLSDLGCTLHLRLQDDFAFELVNHSLFLFHLLDFLLVLFHFQSFFMSHRRVQHSELLLLVTLNQCLSIPLSLDLSMPLNNF